MKFVIVFLGVAAFIVSASPDEQIAKTLLDSLDDAMWNKDMTALRQHLSSDIKFIGCKTKKSDEDFFELLNNFKKPSSRMSYKIDSAILKSDKKQLDIHVTTENGIKKFYEAKMIDGKYMISLVKRTNCENIE